MILGADIYEIVPAGSYTDKDLAYYGVIKNQMQYLTYGLKCVTIRKNEVLI